MLPARYPELAAIVGESSDNLPGVPGVGPGFAASWINQYDGLEGVITHADQITGKEGESLREHLGDVIRNRRLNALVRDLDLELAPADLEAQSWDRAAGAQALRRPGVPGAARPAVRVVGRPGRHADRRLRLRARGGPAGARRGGRLARRPTPAPTPAPVSPCTAAGAPAPARSAGSPWRPPTARPRGSTPPTSRPTTTLRSRLARRAPSAPRCCTTPRARCSPWRLGAGRCAGWSATPRWRPTSSGPTSAPTTWPT